MRMYLVDFTSVITDPATGLKNAVQLGYEHLETETQGLRDGEEVIVYSPGELWAKAYVTHRDDKRGRYWLAEMIAPWHYYDEEGGPESFFEVQSDAQSLSTTAQ